MILLTFKSDTIDLLRHPQLLRFIGKAIWANSILSENVDSASLDMMTIIRALILRIRTPPQ